MTVPQFEAVCRAVFEAGDRQTYCNRFNDNPHVDAGWFDPRVGVSCEHPEDAGASTLRPIPFEGNYARFRHHGDRIDIDPDEWPAERLQAAVDWLLDFAQRVGKLSGPPIPR